MSTSSSGGTVSTIVAKMETPYKADCLHETFLSAPESCLGFVSSSLSSLNVGSCGSGGGSRTNFERSDDTNLRLSLGQTNLGCIDRCLSLGRSLASCSELGNA